jgi:hypothetical protein
MKLTATYKGLITGAVMIAVSLLLFYGMKLPHDDPSQLIVIGIYIIGIVWSMISLHRSSSEVLTFKKYFSEGFKTFIVMTLMMVVFKGLFYYFNPQILEDVIKQNEILISKTGNKTPPEIKANSDSLRSIFMPMTLSLTTVTYLLFGAVTAVVGGLGLKAYGSGRK